MEKSMYELVATCMFGLEKFLGEEIDALGYERVETIDGRVTFRAPIEGVAYSNIFFHYAERVLIKVGSFRATTFEELFQGTKALDWSEWIDRFDAFPVKGHSIRSKLFSVSDCQSIVKKAIVENLKEEYEINYFEETDIKYQIEFLILNDNVTMMIDTSGDGLHKRGYRTQANLAPLKETLAAAIVNLSRPRENVIICDPMCGSGTLLIEAAMMCAGFAPGRNRRFVAEQYPQIPESAWTEARAKAKSMETEPKMQIIGYDVDPNTVAIAKENAKRAGVENFVKFYVRDARDFKNPVEGARGTIIMNPPYGERMGEKREVQMLIKEVGKTFQREIPNWQKYILSSDEEFEKFFGRKADKARKLYNGMLKCYLYQYFKKQY